MASNSRHCTGSAIHVNLALGNAYSLQAITIIFFFKRFFGNSCCNFLWKKTRACPVCNELPTTDDTWSLKLVTVHCLHRSDRRHTLSSATIAFDSVVRRISRPPLIHRLIIFFSSLASCDSFWKSPRFDQDNQRSEPHNQQHKAR